MPSSILCKCELHSMGSAPYYKVIRCFSGLLIDMNGIMVHQYIGAGHTCQWLSIKSVRIAFYDYATVISKPNRCSPQHCKVAQGSERVFSKAPLHRVLRTSCLAGGRKKRGADETIWIGSRLAPANRFLI